MRMSIFTGHFLIKKIGTAFIYSTESEPGRFERSDPDPVKNRQKAYSFVHHGQTIRKRLEVEGLGCSGIGCGANS
jgi:hypothetical protein